MSGNLPQECDVAIVGGGPAGLAAATALRACGVKSVIVLEREREAGGIPRHCGHYPFGMREFHRVLRGPDYAARLAARARAAGVQIHCATTVVGLHEGPRLTVTTTAGLHELSAKRVLVCTGVRETSRANALVGGTKPGGILSTGALQGLVYLKNMKPFSKPVIVGTELVSFSALLTCSHIGIRPAAMIERHDRPTAHRLSSVLPIAMRVPLRFRTEVVAVHGTDRVSEVVVRDGKGQIETLEADGVIFSGRFVPEAALARASHLACDPGTGGPEIDQYGRCSDPDYFAAGNLLRAVETAGWSWQEGTRVGQIIADSLSGKLPAPGPVLKLVLGSDVLKYVVPGRLAPQGGAGITECLQLRVKHAVKGRLQVSVNGTPVVSRSLSALPERRILVPFDCIPALAEGIVEFSVTERD